MARDDDARGFDEHTQLTGSRAVALAGLPGLVRKPPRIEWRVASALEQRGIDRRLVVGSAPESDLILVDPKVSRIHAQLEPRQDGVWISDLGSRNGSYVDGVRVQSARLHEGARVRMGDVELVIHYGAEENVAGLWPLDRFGPLLGRSIAMRELFGWLERAAQSDATLLVEGETGTGKELVASAVHEASSRGHKPLSVIDCAALTDTLLEDELFGHAKGSFTGAHAARAGAIEAADGGTVFIDEIGELPLALQPKLLRVLESRSVRRIGENERRKVDVRFVTATHRDLRSMVNEGTFREDLYFRLAVLSVRVPPLRERQGDIPMLAERFVPKGTSLPPDVLRDLEGRAWRGNVRELRNYVERAIAFGPDRARAAEPVPEAGAALDTYHAARAELLTRFERDYLAKLLAQHPGNMAAAARHAGVTRAYLYQLIEKHGLR